MENKICATVILYNPDNSIITNINSYVKNVSKLFIVDNSEVVNQELIEEVKNIHANIEYINNNGNVGIATALNLACDRAIESNMKWILTMDQDSRFLDFPSFIKCFTSLAQTNNNIGIITANHTGDTTYTAHSQECSYIEKELVITSGNIINLQYFNKIGRFDDKLFIDMVDYDFSHKCVSNNLKILLLKKHFILHHIGEVFFRKNLITRKIKSKIEHNAQRVYYITRNRLYLSKKYTKHSPHEYGFIKTFNLLFIHEVIKILLYESDKYAKIRAKTIALMHFFTNKMGKYQI